MHPRVGICIYMNETVTILWKDILLARHRYACAPGTLVSNLEFFQYNFVQTTVEVFSFQVGFAPI